MSSSSRCSSTYVFLGAVELSVVSYRDNAHRQEEDTPKGRQDDDETPKMRPRIVVTEANYTMNKGESTVPEVIVTTTNHIPFQMYS